MFINFSVNEGFDKVIKGWWGFFNVCGIIWDIIFNVLSFKFLLSEMNGKLGLI